MNGRLYLDVARRLAGGPTEADWRTSVGRAYYALFLEARDALSRWGFSKTGRDQVHAFVRLKFLYANPRDLKEIGKALEDLGLLRNRADYQIETPGRYFANGSQARAAIHQAAGAIAELDRIESDPGSRASAIAAIRAGSP